MKGKITSSLMLLFSILFTNIIFCQYYTVPATGNGNFTVGGVVTNVARQGNASTFTCFGNPLPYFQGIRNESKVTYTFNKDIAGVKIYGFISTAANNIISVSVNGSPYTLQNSNLSGYSGICAWGIGTISAGKLINGDGTLTITQPNIKSIEIYNSGGNPAGEWIFNVDILPLSIETNNSCGSSLNLTTDFAGLTTGVTYNWTGPNGFVSNTKNPSITNASSVNAGQYKVIASNGSLTASQTKMVFVNPIPTINSLSNKTICSGETVDIPDFTTNTKGVICGNVNENETLNLSAPTGSVFTNVLFASYGNPSGSCGNFTLGSCNSNTSVNVISNVAIGNNSFSIAATNANFGDPCSGTAKNLKVQLNYDTPIIYKWTNSNTSIGLGASGTGQIPTFNAVNNTNAPITSTVTVTPSYVNEGNTCNGTPITFTITVNPLPKITTQPSSKTVCLGAGTNFSATINNVSTYQWQVDKGSGFNNVSNVSPYSGATTATLTINETTSEMNGYKYKLLATGNCSPGITSNVVELSIASTSVPTGEAIQSFNAGDNLGVLVVNGENIKWYATETNAINHTNVLPVTTNIVNNTTYYATQTIGTCESLSALAVKAYNETLSISETSKAYQTLLYPNPVKDILNLSSETTIHKVIISDYSGKKLLEKSLNGSKTVDVQSLVKGTYVIQIFTEKGMETIKFIKN